MPVYITKQKKIKTHRKTTLPTTRHTNKTSNGVCDRQQLEVVLLPFRP